MPYIREPYKGYADDRAYIETELDRLEQCHCEWRNRRYSYRHKRKPYSDEIREFGAPEALSSLDNSRDAWEINEFPCAVEQCMSRIYTVAIKTEYPGWASLSCPPTLEDLKEVWGRLKRHAELHYPL